MEMHCSVFPKINNYGIVLFLVIFSVALGINSSHTLKDLCTSTDNQHFHSQFYDIESTIIKSNEPIQKRIIRVLNYKYRQNISENNEFEYQEIKKFSCCQTCSMCRNGVFQLDTKDKNCLIPEFIRCSYYKPYNFYRYNNYLLKYKRPCKDEQLREFFNDPLEIYNITFEKEAAIPFISGINIYFFADKEDKCMTLFSGTMDSKVQITNRDINRFFMRFESCTTTVRFTNEYNILIYTLFGAYIIGEFEFLQNSSSWPDSKSSFFAEFKNRDCLEHFYKFTLKHSLNDRLSASDINKFTVEKQCLVSFRFFGGTLFYVHASSPYFVYIATAFTGILVLVGEAFNFMSGLTTTFLCIQQSLSFMFPVWSKYNLQIKFWTIFAVLVMVFTQICFIPWIHGTRQTLLNDNGICLHDMDGHRSLANILEYYLWTVSVSYCLAVVVVLTCVVYITCKLKRQRIYRHQTHSSVIWSNYRRSAMTVITIGIIFIFSDLLHIFTWFVDTISFSLPQTYQTFGSVYYDNLSFILDLTSFCLLSGFLRNFAVYILASEQLRGILYKRVAVVI